MMWIGALALGFVLGLYQAVLARSLWAWYLTPVIGIAAPSIIGVYGIMVLGVLFLRLPKTEGKKPEQLMKDALAVNLAYTFVFAIAWVLHFFL